jgi:hypothetical protein
MTANGGAMNGQRRREDAEMDPIEVSIDIAIALGVPPKEYEPLWHDFGEGRAAVALHYQGRRLQVEVKDLGEWVGRGKHAGCPGCEEPSEHKPFHMGSPWCESGSLASGGSVAHCTCDVCF